VNKRHFVVTPHRNVRGTLGDSGLRRVAVFIAIGLALATSAPAASLPGKITAVPGWRAGTGRENITPPAGLWMTGYAVRDRPADGTSQELWVKALAVQDPSGERGVLLTLDLCDVTRVISEHVAIELMQRYALPRSAIMTNVSHTHCAPWIEGGIAGLRIFPPDGVAKAAAFRRELETKMVRAACAALDSLAPASLSWGEDAAHFGYNRRENPADQVPALRAAGKLKGPFDPRVPVLAFHAADGSLRGLLVSYACHNTTLMEYTWHGDYAGSAQLELERRHPGATVLFGMGCGADANPAPRRELDHAEQHGRELADAADRVLAKKMTPVEGKFASAFEDITLTFARKPTDEELRIAREKDQPNKEMHQAWSATITEQLRTKGDRILEYSYPIQAWRIGTLSWAALAGEVVIDYSNRLRSEVGPDLWVFGYSTDVMAYIPSERVLKEGRYEGESSMIPHGRPSKWNPGLEDKIVAKTRELIARTRDAK
jgi:neutral ceramidase